MIYTAKPRSCFSLTDVSNFPHTGTMCDRQSLHDTQQYVEEPINEARICATSASRTFCNYCCHQASASIKKRSFMFTSKVPSSLGSSAQLWHQPEIGMKATCVGDPGLDPDPGFLDQDHHQDQDPVRVKDGHQAPTVLYLRAMFQLNIYCTS